MNLNDLPFNAFDLFVVIILVTGIYHGRKVGMSGSLIPLLKWLVVLFLCAAAYEPIGSMLSQTSTMFSTLSCYLMAYVGSALIVVLLFAAINRALNGKLVGSDLFGRSEYYLGMGSGCIKFACILLAGLAILNARYFSPTQVKANEKFQKDMYGSEFFPGLHTLQASVFETSLTGPWIRENLGFLLIKPTEHEEKQLHQQEAKWQ